jgi:quercetin dioxygenase-like cupin family protein
VNGGAATDGADPISLLGGRCPRSFRLRTLTLQPGHAIDYHAGDWVDSLVVVERGELELECCSGVRARFSAGAILALNGLTLRRLCNASSSPLVLSALSRVPSAD